MRDEMEQDDFRPSITHPTHDAFEASERLLDRRLLRRIAEQTAEVQLSIHMLDRKIATLEGHVVPRFGSLQDHIKQAVQLGTMQTVVILCCIAAYYRLTLQYQWIAWAAPVAALAWAVFTMARDIRRNVREIDRREAEDAANRVS